MTHRQAVSEFRIEHLPFIHNRERQQTGRPDYPLRREAWNLFVGDLYSDNRISANQLQKWDQPHFCNPKRSKRR